MDLKKIKAKARKRLHGNYGLLICAMIIYSLVEALFSGTSILIFNRYMDIFFNIIIFGLLYEGLLSIVIKVARGKKTQLSDLFNKTDLFWKTAAVTIVLSAFTTLCTVMGLISGRSLYVFMNYQSDISTTLSSFMIFIGILLIAAIVAFFIVMMIYFSQVYFVLYDNPKMSVFDIFGKSMDLIEEHKFEYLVFNLSFVGWAILGMFTFGLLYLWLAPYMFVSEALFYDDLKKLEKDN